MSLTVTHWRKEAARLPQAAPRLQPMDSEN